MEAIVQGNIIRILSAVASADQELREYRRDPAFRAEDRASDEERIAAHRERTIADAVNEIDKAERRMVADFERFRQTRWDEPAVAAAERRVDTMLSKLGVADVLAAPGMTRETFEALRRVWPVRVAMSGATEAEAARQIAGVERSILRAELPMMGPDERRATEAHLEWQETRPGLAALGTFLADVRGGRADAASQITVGLALSGAGFVAPEPHRTPEQIADRERNSLPPEVRGKLDANAGVRG